MPITPVSISNDLAMPVIPLGMTFHDVTPPPPAPPIPAAPCVEPPVMMMWPPGFALFQNKLTTTVLHKAMPIVLDGHNCGYMLIHVSIPPANLLTPMQIAFSSRKVAFASSTVKANGTAMACVFPSFLMPMTCCAQPVTMPNGIALLNVVNTIYIGLSWMDFIVGWISIGATMIIDRLTYSPKKLMGWRGIIEDQLKDLKRKLLLGDKPSKWLAKTITGAVIGAGRIIFSGEGSISVSVGSNYLGGSISFSRTKEANTSLGISGNEVTSDRLFGPATGRQASAQYTWNADGTRTTTTTTKSASADSGLGSREGSQNVQTTKTTKDADGNVVSSTTSGTQTHTEDTPWSGSTDVQQQRTTSKPGQPPKTTSSSASSASRWGDPL